MMLCIMIKYQIGAITTRENEILSIKRIDGHGCSGCYLHKEYIYSDNLKCYYCGHPYRETTNFKDSIMFTHNIIGDLTSRPSWCHLNNE